MQAKCRGVRPSLFVFSVSALPYWVLKSLDWVEAWFLSTNCLSFDWWIFDLVTFKNYKEKLTCTSRIVAISVLLFKAATWRAVLLLFESGSSVNSGHFAVTLFAALEKQRLYSDVVVKIISIPYLVWRNTFSMSFYLEPNHLKINKGIASLHDFQCYKFHRRRNWGRGGGAFLPK